MVLLWLRVGRDSDALGDFDRVADRSYVLNAMSGDMTGLMMTAIAELSDPDHPMTAQVRSLATNAQPPASTHQFIEVSNDIDDVVLGFTSGFSIQGQVTVSGMASVRELAG